MAKVLAAVTTTGTIDAYCSQTMAEIVRLYPNTDYLTLKGRPTDYIRNLLVRKFLERPDYTHLFMVDSDEAVPVNTVERLLKHDVPIATGCYPAYCDDDIKWALAMRGNDGLYRLIPRLADSSAPFWVDAGGAGCLLIRRDVFDKITFPWFKWGENETGIQESEDIYFFKKCNEAGIRCLADPTVLVHHFKTVNLLPIMLKLDSQRRKQDENKTA